MEPAALPLTPDETARKASLIERKIRGEASPAELSEIEELKKKTAAWLRQVAPLPLEAVRLQGARPRKTPATQED